MTANGKILVSDAMLREWLRLPEHIKIAGLSFDERTITVRIHDSQHPEEPEGSEPAYTLLYESVEGRSYRLLEMRRNS